MSPLGILLLLLAFNNSKKVQTGLGFYINSEGKRCIVLSLQDRIDLLESEYSLEWEDVSFERKQIYKSLGYMNEKIWKDPLSSKRVETLYSKDWEDLSSIELINLEALGFNQELWDNYEYDSENNKFYKSRKKLSPEEFYETLTDKEKETLNGLIDDLDKNIKNLDDDRLSIYVTLLNMLKGTKYNSAQILKSFGNLTVEEFIKKFKLAPSINGLYWDDLSNDAKLYLGKLGYTQYLWDNIDL